MGTGTFVHRAALAAVGGLVALAAAAPAHAAGLATPRLLVAASPSTRVGLQVFANVNLMNAASPTGSMTFRLYRPGDPSCGSAPAFVSTVPVATTSVNSDRFTADQAGTWHWTAAYSGDAANAATGPTSCADAGAAVLVDKARPVLSVTAAAPAGGAIRARATLAGGVAPAGNVTFVLSPPGDTFCNSHVFTSTVAVNGAGTYESAPYAAQALGTYRWRASYTGDADNLAVNLTGCLDANAAVSVTSLAPATTTTTGPANPGGPPAAPAGGTPRPVGPAPTPTPTPAPAPPAALTAPTCTVLQVLDRAFRVFAGDLFTALGRALGCA